jgi:hypothetical protein
MKAGTLEQPLRIFCKNMKEPPWRKRLFEVVDEDGSGDAETPMHSTITHTYEQT